MTHCCAPHTLLVVWICTAAYMRACLPSRTMTRLSGPPTMCMPRGRVRVHSRLGPVNTATCMGAWLQVVMGLELPADSPRLFASLLPPEEKKAEALRCVGARAPCP